MFRLRLFRDDTGETIGTSTVDKLLIVGDRIGSIVIDDKDLPGTVTRVDNTPLMEGDELIHGRVWVKQDSYD